MVKNCLLIGDGTKVKGKIMLSQDLKNKIIAFCKAHPLYSPDKKVVIGRGVLPSPVLFIGEAPGKTENEQGIPFCGRSGDILNKWIESKNLKDKAGITNTCFLIPLDAEGKIRKPTDKEISDFKPLLYDIISECAPKYVVLVGSAATESVLGKPIKDCFGKIFEEKGYKILSIYHPAYYMRNGRDGLDDFAKLEFAFKQQELLTDFKVNKQDAHDYSVKHMISEPIAAIEKLCKYAGVPFKDKDSDMCFIDDKEAYIGKFAQTNEWDIFEQELQTKFKNTQLFIAYNIEQGNYNFFGYTTKSFLDSLPMGFHYKAEKNCKKIMNTDLKNLSEIIKIYRDIEEKKEVPTQPYVPLHLHSEYSVQDGYGTVDEIAKALKEKGFLGAAITDHGNLMGSYYFQKAMKKQGLKPIIGIEAYMKQSADSEYRHHITILVKNQEGWNNLLILNEKANRENFYRKPIFFFNELIEHSAGLVCLSGCLFDGILGKHLREQKPDEGEKLALKLKEAFKDDFYCEIMPHFALKGAKEVNEYVINFANMNGIRLVITPDTHYPNKEDKKYHTAVRAVGSRKKYYDDGVAYTGDTYHQLTADEIKNEYTQAMSIDCSPYLQNTLEVFEKCNFEISRMKESDTLPDVGRIIGDNRAPDEIFKSQVYEAYKEDKEYYGKVDDRVELEVNRVIKKGYSAYTLMIKDICELADRNDIRRGAGRGSISGSYTAKLLGIHKTDSIKYKLIFDRYCSDIRKDYPDIDLDFQDTKRQHLLDLIRIRYGEKKVCHILAFSRWHAKGAIRDVGRMCGLPMSECEAICALVVTRSGGDARANYGCLDTFTEFEKAKEFAKKYPFETDLMIKLETRLRHISIHAAGIAITRKESNHYYPIYRVSNEISYAYEKKALEELGIIKIDVLGLKTLDVIDDVIKNAKITNLPENDFDDPAVYKDILANKNCLGVFQMETAGLSKLLFEMKCSEFKDLYVATSLFRPGPLHSGLCAAYVLRKNGKEEVEKIHPLYDECVGDTLGIVIFQEQVMQLMHSVGGLSWATSEMIRKTISKSQGKATFDEIKEQFVKGAVKNGLNKEDADKIFTNVSTFGSYSFNRAHGASYSILSYQTAWLKKYYPKEFIVALLNRENVASMESNYVHNARDMGIEVLPPDINISEPGYSVKNGKIYCGIARIKGIGEKTVGKLLTGRPFRSLEDFCSKTSVGKSTYEALVLSGALDALESNRKFAIDNFEKIKKGYIAEKLTSYFEGFEKKEEVLNKGADYDDKDRLFKQLEYLHFPTEKHPILLYDDPFNGMVKYEPISSMKFEDYESERWIRGMVTFINYKQEGLEGQWTMFDNVLERKYVHANLNDESGGNVLVHFSPEQYTQYKKYFERGVGIPMVVKGSSIPNYQKIYSDAVVIMDDVNRDHPIFKYVKDGRKSEVDMLRSEHSKPVMNRHGKICKVKVDVICSVKYKVSKNKKAYAMLMFYGCDREDRHMCFKLDSKIFTAGEIIVYSQEEGLPFIEVIRRL